MENMDRLSYQALTPTDSAEQVEAYLKALTWAFQQKNIHNIALSGPYGSGKSSIIDTFLRRERERRRSIADWILDRNHKISERSLKVSMAEFEIWQGDSGKKGKTNRVGDDSSRNRIDVEEWILKQIFYKVKSTKIPQSRYHRLHCRSFCRDYSSAAFAFFLISLLVFLFIPSVFERIVDFVDFISLWFEVSTMTAAGGLFAVAGLILMPAVYQWRFLFSNIQLKSLKLPADTGIESERASDSAFNKYLDEIVYFFEETKYRIVFFEDMDRLDDPNIFVRLRELNTLLNNSDAISDQPIFFVYAVRDDIFCGADRTKFFDFIIPVIPVINPTNSGEVLLEWLRTAKKNYHYGYHISSEFMRDIAPYIEDMRILRNVCNEFLIYRGTLKKSEKITLADHKMFAMILFKNLYPREFAEIQADRGLLKAVFEGKASYRKKKETEIIKEINSNEGWTSEEDILCRENVLRDFEYAPLHTIIDEDNILQVRENATQNGLLVFLLRRGYIDETYADYINYFKGVSYPASDQNFVRALKELKGMDFFYELHQPLAVIRELTAVEFGQKEIYNRDLVDALLVQDGEQDKKEALYERLKVGDKISWEFLCFYMESGKQVRKLIAELVARWQQIWFRMEDHTWIGKDQQDLFLMRILESVSAQRIAELNVRETLTDVFERNADILQRLKAVRPNAICEALETLSVQFRHLEIEGVPKTVLDDVFDHNRYVLNTDMVRNVIAHKAPHLTEEFSTKKYTVIRKSGYDPLIEYVQDNLAEYVKEVVLLQERPNDDVDDVLTLLDTLFDEEELCEKLIEQEDFCVSRLKDCCFSHLQTSADRVHGIWDLLLLHRKVEPTWENIYEYWKSFQFTTELRAFIESNVDPIRGANMPYLDDTFIHAFVNEKFDMPILRILLPLLREEHIDADTVDGRFLEKVLFAPETKPALKEALFQKYAEMYITEKLAKNLCDLKLPMTQSIFFAAWGYLDDIERIRLMEVNADILEDDDFQNCFDDMDEPYRGFSDRSKHKVRIPKTDASIRIVQRLCEVGYLTSFEDESISPSRRNEGDPVEIACWVKAVT